MTAEQHIASAYTGEDFERLAKDCRDDYFANALRAAAAQARKIAELRNRKPTLYLPCPICRGIEGCDHAVPERREAWERANAAEARVAELSAELLKLRRPPNEGCNTYFLDND